MVSAREQFLAAVYTGPLHRADAIVVLCGEDAEQRAVAAVELWRQGAAPVIVCSGGVDSEPRWIGGERLAGLLMARSVPPKAIIVEHGSQNTHEQARNLIEMAEANDWHRLCIVASAYHIPRAMLTFIKTIGTLPMHVVAVPASQLTWWGSPPGMDVTRLELFNVEMAKIEEYGEHCATWAEGLAYIERFEGRTK